MRLPSEHDTLGHESDFYDFHGFPNSPEEQPSSHPLEEIVLDPVRSASTAATSPMVKAPPPCLVEQLTSGSASTPIPAQGDKEKVTPDTSAQKEAPANQPATPVEKRFEGDFLEMARGSVYRSQPRQLENHHFHAT
eukprot:2084047-Amphidinium_carterae.3